jgi:hypothetical protein
MSEHEEHVVEVVLRLQAHDERRVPVLFEDHRGDEGGFDAHDLTRPHDLAERCEGGSDAVMIVPQGVEESLDLPRRAVGVDDGAFLPGEHAAGRWQVGGHGSESSRANAATPAGPTAGMLY